MKDLHTPDAYRLKGDELAYCGANGDGETEECVIRRLI